MSATIEAQDSELQEITRKIKLARSVGKRIQERRASLAGALSGFTGVSVEVEFPEPDIMHVYQCTFGRRMGGEPVVYRLSFGKSLKWVGVSHPWGMKPADIIVDDKSVADGKDTKK